MRIWKKAIFVSPSRLCPSLSSAISRPGCRSLGARQLWPLIAVFLVTGCAANGGAGYPVSEDLLVAGFPDLPSDARQVAERLASCSHFAGELGGDGSDRDGEIVSVMAELRCEAIDQDVAAMRQKYAGSRSVQEALVAASQL